MIYCDISLVVSALLFNEPASEAADAWLAQHEREGLAISAWVHVEIVSAVAMKTRSGQLDAAMRASVLRTWSTIRPSFAALSVEPAHFERAASLLLEGGSRLRSGDALHLAIALEHGCPLATLDSVLHQAAVEHGIGADPIIAY